jgi:hypothetical protein
VLEALADNPAARALPLLAALAAGADADVGVGAVGGARLVVRCGR